MKSQVLYIVWCHYISGEATGEIGTVSLLGVKGSTGTAHGLLSREEIPYSSGNSIKQRQEDLKWAEAEISRESGLLTPQTRS